MKKILLILGFFMVSLNVQAILLTDLLNGQVIVAGDKRFDQWDVLDQSASTGLLVNTDNIDVTALNDGGLDPGPGLHFDILNNEFLVDGDDVFAYLDFMFGFRVTSLVPHLKIKDNSLSLTDAELINSSTLTSVFIEENIYTDGTLVDWLGVKTVELSDVFGTQTAKLFDSAEFAPGGSIYVTKNILVEAWDVGESANLISFEQRFSQVVPEPGIFALFGIGLIGLRLSRRSK